MLAQVFRRPVAGGNQLHQALHRLRIFGQKGQIAGAAANGFQQLQGTRQGGIRVGLFGRREDKLRQQLAHALAAAFRQTAIAAAQSELQQALRAVGSLLKTVFGQHVLQRGLVHVLVPNLLLRRFLLPENLPKLLADHGAVCAELRIQRGVVGIAHAQRQQSALGGIVRDVLGLLVVQILQPVLQIAQKNIGRIQLRH